MEIRVFKWECLLCGPNKQMIWVITEKIARLKCTSCWKVNHVIAAEEQITEGHGHPGCSVQYIFPKVYVFGKRIF